MADVQRIGANFTIDVSELQSGLKTANKLIRESESQFKLAAAGMDDWTTSSEGLTERITHLTNVTELQSKKVDALKENYQKLVKDGLDETSDRAIYLRTQITNEKTALEKNKKELKKQTEALAELGNESQDAADDIEEIEEATEKSSKGLSALKGAAAIGVAAIAAVAGAAVAGVKSLLDLAESTREYREDLNKLQTGFQTAGFSAEEATKVYKDFYAVLGEEDRSVEAVNHLAKLCDTQEDLNKWTDIATGVWATFGDSLPIEGLTEAANETAKVGDLTGVLADALNWAGVNEEDFQAKLDACNSESERASLITETLNKLYADSADKYRELNKEIMDANYAQSEMADSMAELGAAAEPLNTNIQELKSSILTGLTPSLKDLLGAIGEVLDGTDGGIQNLSSSVDALVTTILDKVTEALPKIIEVAANIIFTIADTLISNLPKIIESGIKILAVLIQTLADKIPDLIPTMVDAVILMAETLIDNIDLIIDAGINLILGLADGLIKALPRLIDKIPVIIQKLVDALTNNIPKLIQMGIQLLNGLSQGLIEAIPQLIRQLPTIISSIVKGLIEGIPMLVQAGGDLLAGLFKGMLNPSVIWDNIKGIGNSILDGFKSFFGIHSPSKLFENEIGSYMGEGLALGIGEGFDKRIGNVNKTIVKSFDNGSINNTPSNKNANTGSLNSSSGVVVNQYNTFSQSHSRYELFKSKQATAAAVRLAVSK